MPDETPGDKAQAAAIRRRWITLGEGVAVAAVLISGLTFWNSYADRQAQQADRSTSEAKATTKAQRLLLKATPSKNGDLLTLVPLSGEQAIQAQTIAFPTTLKLTPVDTTGDARIEARWFHDPLVAARKAARRPSQTRGDERLPVLITTRYLADGAVLADTAIYELGYATDSGFLQGTSVRLRGLSLQTRVHGGDGQARLDALWALRMPVAP